MFEQMRTYRVLYARIHHWLRPGGRFFKHLFVHRAVPYEFADRGPGDWMSRYCFSGGLMPSLDLPLRFQEHLRFVRRWPWSGRHNQKIANAWLERLDTNRDALLPTSLPRGRAAGRTYPRFIELLAERNVASRPTTTSFRSVAGKADWNTTAAT